MRIIARSTLVDFGNRHPAGGNYRLIVAFDFRRQVAFVKFVGTHAEYDRVDALTVSKF
jgi:mRNA interferase HigB